MKKTEWYPPEIQPLRKGVYELKPSSGNKYPFPFFFWDGKNWCNCDRNPDLCFKSYSSNYFVTISGIGGNWRGLASNPE